MKASTKNAVNLQNAPKLSMITGCIILLLMRCLQLLTYTWSTNCNQRASHYFVAVVVMQEMQLSKANGAYPLMQRQQWRGDELHQNL